MKCFAVFMRSFIVFIFLNVLTYVSFSQEIDTIDYSYRTGGELDSVDFSFSFPMSTFSGGVLDGLNNYISADFIYSNPSLLNFVDRNVYSNMKFSALPHLGFSYSFGGSSTQFVHFDYQHSTQNTLLNIDYNRSSSLGFIRNSDFLKNDISIQLSRLGKKVDFLLLSSFGDKDLGLSGGVLSDTFVDEQGVSFLPVKYDNSRSAFKEADVTLSNFYHKKKDSVVYSSVGVQSFHAFNSISREFSNDVLLTNYNYDSTTTRDQYRTATLQNGLGVYLKSKRLFFNFLANHTYLHYQNLGLHTDTNEFNLTSNLHYNKEHFCFKNEFSLNLIGAGRERYNNSYFSFELKGFQFFGELMYSQLWPLFNQRKYYSNLYNLNLSEFDLQTKFKQSLTMTKTWSNKQSVYFKASNYTMKNNYFFIEDKWRNDTLTSINMQTLELGGGVNYKHFYLNPTIGLNFISSEINITPSYVLNNRMFVKGKLFKAKKMEAIFGVDISYFSSYNMLDYNPVVDAFVFSDDIKRFKGYYLLSPYFGFEIGEFRMYARIENMQYPFIDKTNQIIIGYPVQPNFVRLGVTWDFFN